MVWENVHLASRRRGSKGGYMALTTSSTRGPILLAMDTRSVMVSWEVSCWEFPMVIPTSFSVRRWAIFRMAKQCGTRPLKNNKRAWLKNEWEYCLSHLGNRRRCYPTDARGHLPSAKKQCKTYDLLTKSSTEHVAGLCLPTEECAHFWQVHQAKYWSLDGECRIPLPLVLCVLSSCPPIVHVVGIIQADPGASKMHR